MFNIIGNVLNDLSHSLGQINKLILGYLCAKNEEKIIAQYKMISVKIYAFEIQK